MAGTTTERRRRGASVASEAMKRSILDAASEVFAESGYRAGSVRAIAEKVGITDAGVLHHFGSKNALLAEVLEWRDERIAPLLPEPGTSGVETFIGLLRIADYIPTEPGIARLHSTLLAESTDPSHPAHEFFVKRYDRTRDGLVDDFRQAAVQGRLRAGVDPVHAAAATLAIMDGLQLQWLLHPDAVIIRETLTAHFTSLVEMPTQ
jgi:AcrR family transcriptional regulator